LGGPFGGRRHHTLRLSAWCDADLIPERFGLPFTCYTENRINLMEMWASAVDKTFWNSPAKNIRKKEQPERLPIKCENSLTTKTWF
jgi:hypothetical protein